MTDDGIDESDKPSKQSDDDTSGTFDLWSKEALISSIQDNKKIITLCIFALFFASMFFVKQNESADLLHLYNDEIAKNQILAKENKKLTRQLDREKLLRKQEKVTIDGLVNSSKKLREKIEAEKAQNPCFHVYIGKTFSKKIPTPILGGLFGTSTNKSFEVRGVSKASGMATIRDSAGSTREVSCSYVP